VERTSGSGDVQPVDSFMAACERYDLPDALVANIERCGYNTPTPVQKHAIPAALECTDVMVSAQTGSGKTAAFLTPIIATAMRVGPKALALGPVCPTSFVLAPTRELCQQIAVEARRLTFRSDIRVACINGGAEAMPQLRALAEGVEIAICTPGRLQDFLNRGVISMEAVKHLVLDEADRMLDMGLEPQIRSIIEDFGMPKSGRGPDDRQTMMFSATFPSEVQELALEYLDASYMSISIGHVGCTASNVEQRFADCSHVAGADGKFSVLLEQMELVEKLLGERDTAVKTIIFANQKVVVDDLALKLCMTKVKASPIHGGLSQPARDRALEDLKSGRISVLVATDVAARGLDLPGVDHVVIFDLPIGPTAADAYVHRVGRTGRIGNSGIATSLVGRNEPSLKGIVKALWEAVEEDATATRPPAWLEKMAMSTIQTWAVPVQGKWEGRGGRQVTPLRGDSDGAERGGDKPDGGKSDGGGRSVGGYGASGGGYGYRGYGGGGGSRSGLGRDEPP